MDVFNHEKRSWLMSRIKSKDTKPEIVVRSIVHGLGYRFRKNVKDLPGCPDIVLARHHKTIFVHGCFWHGHVRCRKSAKPTSNVSFWTKKLEGNIKRDKRNLKELKSAGWQTMVIWECQLKNETLLIERLNRFLNS